MEPAPKVESSTVSESKPTTKPTDQVSYTQPSEQKTTNNSWIWWLVGCCGCSIILAVIVVIVAVVFGYYSFSQFSSQMEDISGGNIDWDYSTAPDDYSSYGDDYSFDEADWESYYNEYNSADSSSSSSSSGL